MKKNIFNFIALFVSIFLLVSMAGILLVASSKSNLQKKDVTMYSAEVETIKKINVGSESSYKISTKNYSCELFIGQDNVVLDLSNLKKGDTIFFTMENDYCNFFESKNENVSDLFVPIVSLETEKEEILTLEDYNHNLKNSFKSSMRFCLVVIIISFFVFVKSLKGVLRHNNQMIRNH